MLTTAQLTRMRTQQQETMLTTCKVRTITYTPNGEGGQTRGTSDATTVCRYAESTGREAEIAAQMGEQVTTTITLPYGTSVTPAQQIVIGSEVYRIIAVLAGNTFATAVRVLAVRM